MDGALIYAKTPRGVAEVAARSAQLSMVARRVLIMMDGKRTVADLAVFVRPGEIDAIVTQLESAGLAEKTEAGAAPPAPVSAPTTVTAGHTIVQIAPEAPARVAPPTIAPATVSPAAQAGDAVPITLDEAKRRAVRELADRLGPEGDVVAMRIEACRTVEEFRERVREAERYVAVALGTAAAQDYVRALRRRP